jgi:hypothetical protein
MCESKPALERRYDDDVKILTAFTRYEQCYRAFKEVVSEAEKEGKIPDYLAMPCNFFYKNGDLKEVVCGSYTKRGFFEKLDELTEKECNWWCQTKRSLGFY